MAFLKLSKSRPDKHTERARWNDSWENDMKIWEKLKDHPGVTYSEDQKTRAYRLSAQTYLATFNERMRSDVVQLQDDVRRRSIMRLASDGFAEKWAALTPLERKEYILDALYKTSSSGPDFEEYRKWCPELTAKALGQDSQAYLGLLTFLVEAEIKVDGELQITFFPHPIVDNVLKNMRGGDDNIVTKFRLDRTLFITLAVWKVYLAFHGLEEIHRFEELLMEDKAETKRFFREAQKSAFPTRDDRNAYAQRLREFKAADKAIGETNYCWGCGKSEALLPANTQLLACAGCKKIERKVLYCSRECQKNDWKHGAPQPHKEVCGKPWDQTSKSMEAKTAKSTSAKVPEPVPPFKRSPALCYQIRMINRGDSDYTFVLPHPAPDMGIRIPTFNLRCHFLAARTKALKFGDPSAVTAMYQILKGIAKKVAPPSYDLKKQLRGEYGYDIDDTKEYSWKPTRNEEELEEALNLVLSFGETTIRKELQQYQRLTGSGR